MLSLLLSLLLELFLSSLSSCSEISMPDTANDCELMLGLLQWLEPVAEENDDNDDACAVLLLLIDSVRFLLIDYGWLF